MKILITPDKFRHALDAQAVAEAIAAGVCDSLPNAAIVTCPLGDGGEGTGCVLAAALGGEERSATVLDPLGRPRAARWWLCPDRTGIVEMAEASGLALLAPAERDPLRTTTYGTGQLLRAAAEAGGERVLLCVGGSATVDGGAGCLQAMGYGLIDAAGRPIDEPACGGMLDQVAAVRPPLEPPRLEIAVLCDVDNPLLGPRGAAPVFAPQKGAEPADVVRLERGLTHWADVLHRTFNRAVATLAGAGAAGGLPAGLAAALNASLLSGFDEVASRVDLRGKLRDCDLCLTGEGRIDDQTAAGKVVAGVARLAGEHGVPVIALAGEVRTERGQTVEALAHALGIQRIIAVTPPATPLEEALAATAANLRRAARDALREYV